MSLPEVSYPEALNHRRSVYGLKGNLPANVDNALLQKILEGTILKVPSAFNSQSTRIVLVVGEEHKRFWEIVKNEDIKTAPDEASVQRKTGRLNGFASAYGSVLFFESQKVVKQWQTDQPAYEALFPQWSEHTAGMHHLVVWAAFESLPGIGGNLQHYNFLPGLDAIVQKQYDLPEDWKLTAQLVFGEYQEGAFPTEPKPKNPVEETVRVFGA